MVNYARIEILVSFLRTICVLFIRLEVYTADFSDVTKFESFELKSGL